MSMSPLHVCLFSTGTDWGSLELCDWGNWLHLDQHSLAGRPTDCLASYLYKKASFPEGSGALAWSFLASPTWSRPAGP